MYPCIPCKLVTDPLGSAEHRVGTTASEGVRTRYVKCNVIISSVHCMHLTEITLKMKFQTTIPNDIKYCPGSDFLYFFFWQLECPDSLQLECPDSLQLECPDSLQLVPRQSAIGVSRQKFWLPENFVSVTFRALVLHLSLVAAQS